jgi:hypothetical protein
MNFGYFEVLGMPVYERIMYIDLWKKEMEEQQKQYKRAQSKRR